MVRYIRLPTGTPFTLPPLPPYELILGLKDFLKLCSSTMAQQNIMFSFSENVDWIILSISPAKQPNNISSIWLR
jgi:hypothetical protein